MVTDPNETQTDHEFLVFGVDGFSHQILLYHGGNEKEARLVFDDAVKSGKYRFVDLMDRIDYWERE